MNSWVNNPIELSENNAGATSVTVTFTFSVTQAVTNGYLAITFPAGFSNGTEEWTSFSSSNGTGTATVTGVTNPSAAAGYGPFSIVTRHSKFGQIVDSNYVFGSVGIAEAHGQISTFTVAYGTGSSDIVNTSGVSVNF